MAAIVLQFRSETAAAKSAMASLAQSVAGNMGTIASVMGSTALTTVSATSAMGGGFGQAALAAGRFALQYRLLLGTLGIVGLAIAKAAGDLTELVTIGDKAAAVRLSPETFQAFTREAEKSRIAIKDAEAALKAFNTANKVSFDPTSETRPNQPSPLGKFLEDLRLIQRELENSKALDNFLNAPNQDARLRATIEIIRELQAAGRELAATGFAERAFGGAGEKIAQEIRQGKFELESLTAEGKAAGLIFSNELVQRAIDLRNRLEAASREIGDNLTPLLRGSVTIAEALATAFVGATEAVASLTSGLSAVVRLLGSAVNFASQLLKLDPTATAEGIAGLEAKRQRRLNLDAAIRGDRPPEAVDPLERARQSLIAGRGQQLNEQPSQVRITEGFDGAQLTGRNVITNLPPPRPEGLGAPRGGRGGGSAFDEPDKRLKEIENFIKALEKANRLAEAELATAGKSNVEKEKAAALARIGGDLTDAQRQKIEQLAGATAEYRDKQKEVEEAIRRTKEAADFMGNALSDAFSDAIFNGTKLNDVAKNLARSLGSTALKGLLTGQGPFGIGGSGIFGNFGGIFSSIFGGARASGGPVSSGKAYLVGENGPEIFAPGSSGTIIPNGAFGGGSSSGGTVTVYIQSDGTLPAMIQTVARGVAVQVTQQGIAANNSRIPGMLAQQESR
jgi:hypothetical protein